MKKLEYLKKVINESDLYEKKSWYTSCFGILINKKEFNNNLKNLELILQHDGLYCYLENENRLEKIDDYKENLPLFNFSDEVEIDTSWNVNVSKPLKTKIGNLLINKVVLHKSVGNKIEFLEGKLNSEVFENLILQKLKDDKERTENDISVQETIEIVDRLYFLTNIADLINITATPKNIVAPDDLENKKKELMLKYKDSLTDPVKLTEFENELSKIDDEFLKDDPSYGVTLSGKSKKARKKMFLNFGYDKEFDEKTVINPVLDSLEEGLNLEQDKFPSYMNSLRFGSYARGKLTAESGTQTKILLRSLGNLTISNIDCKTTKGVFRKITASNYKKLKDREVKISNKWVLIDSIEEAKKFIDSTVEIRSALYCKSPGNTLCYHCTSKLFENTPNALYHLSTEISSVMMTMFLKLMHDSSVNNTTLKLEDMCT